MDKTVSMREIEAYVDDLENKAGKFVGSYQINESGSVTDVEFMPYGKDDIVINVWNCKMALVKPKKSSSGITYENVNVELTDDELDFLEECLWNQGGSITTSGHYVLPKVGLPESLENKLKTEKLI